MRLTLALAILGGAHGFIAPARSPLAAPRAATLEEAPATEEQRATAARMEAVAAFLATEPAIPRAGGLAPPPRRAYSGPSYPSGGGAPEAALAWDANAAWLARCARGGVVSWYDAGLRLTDEAADAAELRARVLASPLWMDEDAKLAAHDFPFGEDELIFKAKQFLFANGGIDAPGLLADGFKFMGPVVGGAGGLPKAEYLAAVGGFDIREARENSGGPALSLSGMKLSPPFALSRRRSPTSTRASTTSGSTRSSPAACGSRRPRPARTSARSPATCARRASASRRRRRRAASSSTATARSPSTRSAT